MRPQQVSTTCLLVRIMRSIVTALALHHRRSVTWNVSANFNVLYNQSRCTDPRPTVTWLIFIFIITLHSPASKHIVYFHTCKSSLHSFLCISTHKHAELINLIKKKEKSKLTPWTHSQCPQAPDQSCSRLISIVFSYHLWYAYIKTEPKRAPLIIFQSDWLAHGGSCSSSTDEIRSDSLAD